MGASATAVGSAVPQMARDNKEAFSSSTNAHGDAIREDFLPSVGLGSRIHGTAGWGHSRLEAPTGRARR